MMSLFKKRLVIYGIIAIGLFLLGMLIQQLLSNTENTAKSTSPSVDKQQPLYWVAPMDPTYRRDKPGKSPMGMDLVPVYADAANDNTISISPSVEQSLGVRVANVVKQTLAKQINTVGYVMEDEDHIEHIHTYTDGWIKRLLVKAAGEHVKRGQLLFKLYSPTLVNAQEEYVLALNSNNKALINAAHKKLLSLGVSEQHIQQLTKTKKATQLIKIVATQDGIIAKLNVREGMYVKPDTELLTLENLSQIWIIGDVFERQASDVKKGQRAEAKLPYLPGRKWHGHVDYVYPILDPVTHTLKVRLRFDNPDEELKPNMYADIKIFAASENDVLAIPRQAVIYTQSGARVIVSLGNGKYQVKPVTLGIESGDQIAVLSGLTEGEHIVISAQFLIDSESSLTASFNRLDAASDNSKPSHH